MTAEERHIINAKSVPVKMFCFILNRNSAHLNKKFAKMIFNVVRFAIESLNYSTQIIFLIVIILTGGYYVEHTRLLLPTN